MSHTTLSRELQLAAHAFDMLRTPHNFRTVVLNAFRKSFMWGDPRYKKKFFDEINAFYDNVVMKHVQEH